MQRFKTGVSRLFLFFLLSACAAPGTTLQTEYNAIQKIYPRHNSIIKVIFQKQTYFVLADYGRIEKIVRVIESGENNSQLWTVLNLDGELLEVIRYPEMNRYDLTDKQISITGKESILTERYTAEIRKLRTELEGNWEPLIQKIKIKLYRVDATSQATP